MKGFFYVLILFSAFYPTDYLWGQIVGSEKTKIIIGNIYDLEKFTKLPFAHLKSGNKTFNCDSSAHFTLKTIDTDTLIIQYVGYFDFKVELKQQLKNRDTAFLEIFMKPKVYELEEIDLFSLKDFAALKREILRESSLDTEKKTMQKVSDLMKQQLKADYLPYQDGYINYRLNQLKGGGVVFFSTTPGNGIIPAVRKLFKK